jgi:hypothetical protein
MNDDQGDFNEFKPEPNARCRKCAGANVRYRIWESHCGGYEDAQYRCFDCGAGWWVDGIDS